MSKIFIRDAFNYDMSDASRKTGLSCGEPTLAQQSSKDECDINVILRRFGQGASLPQSFRAPTYGDFTGISDFQSAMNAVAAANEAFDSMPAELRYRFANDPQRLMDFLADDKNRAEAIELGLIAKPPLEPAAKPGEASAAAPAAGKAPVQAVPSPSPNAS